MHADACALCIYVRIATRTLMGALNITCNLPMEYVHNDTCITLVIHNMHYDNACYMPPLMRPMCLAHVLHLQHITNMWAPTCPLTKSNTNLLLCVRPVLRFPHIHEFTCRNHWEILMVSNCVLPWRSDKTRIHNKHTQ